MTGGELVARTLKGAGVGHVFTLCGGHILPIYDGCLGEAITLVDVRHEQAAAHCADAYARLTRRVGVAVVAPGPGVTDAVTGVANAYAARSPVLLIAGAAPQALRGLGALQEMDQIALVRSITKGAWTVPETRQIPEVLTSAIRTALSGRPGPVFVEIPVDLLMATVEDRLAPIPRLSIHRPRPAADSDALAHVERLLAAAARPVVVAGGGVYWDDAAESLAAFAERAGAPVFMNGAGRGALPSSHPHAFPRARRLRRLRAGAGVALPPRRGDRARRVSGDDRRRRRRRHRRLRLEGRATRPAGAVARPRAARLSRHRPFVRAHREAPPSETASPPDRRRRCLGAERDGARDGDRKSTRLNSSHGYISYAVFCLKK